MAKRVYFAFHYQDVIDFRANVVRKHKVTKDWEEAGYYDASIWEENKKKGELALKRMINKELEYTSVTAVLIGSQTYARRWVRYEIMKSIERGNGLLGIHINSVAGKDQMTKAQGPNPFDNLGLVVAQDGRTGTPTEWNGREWILYQDLKPFAIREQPASYRGRHHALSHWYHSVYDWMRNDGYNNFSSWIE